ncbi:MAG TPA: flagellar motor protein MotB [Nocardioides sp.]
MAGHGGRRGRRGGHEEEHENHERWLVTYADMVTLLMVLFIVMFAMSAVDEKKFNALKAGLAAGFGQSTSIQDGSDTILDDSGTMPAPMMSGQSQMTAAERAMVQQAVNAAQAQQAQRAYAAAEAEADRLDDVRERLEAALAEHGLADDVVTSIDDRGLVVSLVSRHVVFEADLASLTGRGREILDTIAPVLADLPDQLEISGHTNQVPVKPRYYDTDWDLASARAITVLRYLEEQRGLPGSRMRSTSYGHERPLVDPEEAGSQDVNKRVDVVVLSSLTGTSRDLLGEAAQEQATQPTEPAEPTDTTDHHETNADAGARTGDHEGSTS